MDSIERNIRVEWPLRVVFTDRIFAPDNPVLRDILANITGHRPRKGLVVIDAALAAALPSLACAISAYFAGNRSLIELPCPPLITEGGESCKNSWDRVAAIHALINQHHLDRHSCLFTVGGGALLDMTGLAAATAHRGVRHVRIPTTTLSQCDSGIGVKNGINAFGKKNYIGTFCPPAAVINDFQLLTTLSPRDQRAGFAEAVKVACIRDGAFFAAIEADAAALHGFEPAAMRRLIRRCAELHLDHIAGNGDPFESGSARPLDFGHWAAHRLEQLSAFELRHGEAVAIGIALDIIYARRRGYLAHEDADRVLSLLEALGFQLFTPELLLRRPGDTFRLLEGLDEFREHLGGELAVTLLKGIGNGFEVHEMTHPEIALAIEELAARHLARKSSSPATLL